MNVRHHILLILIALLAVATVSAQTYRTFPGGDLDRATLRVQERVEELYLSGAYERAYFIYRNELAPRGDKYAQYMIGYMHLTGVGVPEDPALALAWYRLAAERGEPSIELSRDELQETLSPAQVELADSLFAKLRAEMSDQVLIYKLIQDDLDLLRDRVDRLNANSASPVLAMDQRHGYVSGAHYYLIIEKRLAIRLQYLKSQVDIIDVDGAGTQALAEIESEIKELIAETDRNQ